MNLYWYFYSDTNARADEIETILTNKNESLTSFYRLEDLLKQLESTPNAVLFLRAHTTYNVYDLCQEISFKFPHIYMIIISPENLENTKKAMQVGASDMLTFSSTVDEVTDVIFQAQAYMKQRNSREPSLQLMKENSRVIAVCSSKGGSGKTFLTVNLAASLAKEGKEVAILDANFQFGDVAMYVDIKPKNSIYEWVKEGVERGEYGIESYLSHHKSGVSILATPPRPEFFEIMTEEHLKIAVTELQKRYDVILIDTPTYISEIHLTCLALADETLLLTTSELPDLRNSKLYLDMMETLHFEEKVRVVLNRDSKHRTIEEKRMEEILQKPIFATLPDQGQLAISSVNEGIPLVVKSSRIPFSKGIKLLGKKLFPPNEQPVKKVKRLALLSR
ncbi:AAA family ATPase [Alkalihalobacillus macyae]|uniref:AAA family ATPase n=1 Tax=Guptibacillus hwajinpoensis TaxID=208199 RepID=UPI00273B18DE|nr:AAA family ATPase [Alkalihalobacillus macyae]MDP4552828.1 AAA family ATPase [Alkalihalobacillus macyae]